MTSSSGARWGRRGVAAEPVVARYIGSGGELRAGGFVFSEVVWTLGLFNGSLRARACDRCSAARDLRRGERFHHGPRVPLAAFLLKKILEEKLERVQILNLYFLCISLLLFTYPSL